MIRYIIFPQGWNLGRKFYQTAVFWSLGKKLGVFIFSWSSSESFQDCLSKRTPTVPCPIIANKNSSLTSSRKLERWGGKCVYLLVELDNCLQFKFLRFLGNGRKYIWKSNWGGKGVYLLVELVKKFSPTDWLDFSLWKPCLLKIFFLQKSCHGIELTQIRSLTAFV